jgi:hypothetical protein
MIFFGYLVFYLGFDIWWDSGSKDCKFNYFLWCFFRYHARTSLTRHYSRAFRTGMARKLTRRLVLSRCQGTRHASAWPGRHHVPCRPDKPRAVPDPCPCRTGPMANYECSHRCSWDIARCWRWLGHRLHCLSGTHHRTASRCPQQIEVP